MIAPPRRGSGQRDERHACHDEDGPGEAPARILVTSSSGAFASFVQAYGEPAPRRELPPREAPDAERLGRVAAEHGIELLGPPGMLPADLSAAR